LFVNAPELFLFRSAIPLLLTSAPEWSEKWGTPTTSNLKGKINMKHVTQNHYLNHGGVLVWFIIIADRNDGYLRNEID
jgi:hypothetical protein